MAEAAGGRRPLGPVPGAVGRGLGCRRRGLPVTREEEEARGQILRGAGPAWPSPAVGLQRCELPPRGEGDGAGPSGEGWRRSRGGATASGVRVCPARRPHSACLALPACLASPAAGGRAPSACPGQTACGAPLGLK